MALTTSTGSQKTDMGPMIKSDTCGAQTIPRRANTPPHYQQARDANARLAGDR
jgi:hypothetical protein